jgi:hypothetical protein
MATCSLSVIPRSTPPCSPRWTAFPSRPAHSPDHPRCWSRIRRCGSQNYATRSVAMTGTSDLIQQEPGRTFSMGSAWYTPAGGAPASEPTGRSDSRVRLGNSARSSTDREMPNRLTTIRARIRSHRPSGYGLVGSDERPVRQALAGQQARAPAEWSIWHPSRPWHRQWRGVHLGGYLKPMASGRVSLCGRPA